MTYIDCYLTPVPRANRTQYEKLALISAEVVREYGALRVVECWLDETGPDAATYHGESARKSADSYGTFTAAVGAKDGETVVMSWVEWPDKRSRDEAMAKVTALMISADAGWVRQSKARAVVAVASGDVMFVHPFNKGPHTQAAMTKRQIQPPARSGRQENEGLRAVPQCGAMIGRRGCGLGDGSKK